MTITPELLKQIVPGNRKPELLKDIAHWMNVYFPPFGIDTVQEMRHFVAQAAHETDNFNTLEEYATGKAYEGRADLGNTKRGYGVKYKGRGIFQTTGYVNYYRAGTILKEPYKFTDNPELLETPEFAVWSACIYWDDRDLNDYANMPDDAVINTKKKGSLSPVKYITYRINGGFNGLTDRIKFYERAKKYIV